MREFLSYRKDRSGLRTTLGMRTALVSVTFGCPLFIAERFEQRFRSGHVTLWRIGLDEHTAPLPPDMLAVPNYACSYTLP